MQTSAETPRHRAHQKPRRCCPCLSPLGQKTGENRTYLPPGPPRMLIMVPIASSSVRCRLSSSLSMTDTGDNVFAFGLSGSIVRLMREPVTSRVTDSTCVCSTTFWFLVGSKGTVPVAQAVRSTAPAQTAGADTSFGILFTALTSLSTLAVDHWQSLFLPVTKDTPSNAKVQCSLCRSATSKTAPPHHGACSFLHHRAPRRQVKHHCLKITHGLTGKKYNSRCPP